MKSARTTTRNTTRRGKRGHDALSAFISLCERQGKRPPKGN